ncbi:hypothetical protein [uncultured Methanolobus sp.]|uniref:hypothetical protein n=1 Tax=uncultured Methanolobus sp. TaxID=218300 RepID=UPI002AAAEF69|nr:hypothetical protein [uncultured Methanolobus sp.]
MNDQDIHFLFTFVFLFAVIVLSQRWYKKTFGISWEKRLYKRHGLVGGLTPFGILFVGGLFLIGQIMMMILSIPGNAEWSFPIVGRITNTQIVIFSVNFIFFVVGPIYIEKGENRKKWKERVLFFLWAVFLYYIATWLLGPI